MQRRFNERWPQKAKPEDEWHWREQQGCGTEPATQVVRHYAGRDLFRCPAHHIEINARWVWAYLQVFRPWQDGRPIAAAIYLDEPARLIDAMQVIEREVNDLDEAKESTPASPGGHASPYAPAPSTGPNATPRKR